MTETIPHLKQSDPAARIASSLNMTLGSDWVSWEPETLWADLKRAGLSVTDILKSKIQAVKTLLTTGAFWKDHLAFEKVAMALNDRTVSFDHYQHPSPAMIARALVQAREVHAGDFSDEVCRYIAVVCFEAGLVVLPDELSVAQESLDDLTKPIVGIHLAQDVRRKWAEGQSAREGVYGETAVGIQLARMASIHEYARSS